MICCKPLALNPSMQCVRDTPRPNSGPGAKFSTRPSVMLHQRSCHAIPCYAMLNYLRPCTGNKGLVWCTFDVIPSKMCCSTQAHNRQHKKCTDIVFHDGTYRQRKDIFTHTGQYKQRIEFHSLYVNSCIRSPLVLAAAAAEHTAHNEQCKREPI